MPRSSAYRLPGGDVPTISLRSDQRVGAIGRTRCGKTFLMERLLADHPRVIVVDSKHRVRWKGYSLTSDPVAALLADKVIYRPDEKVPEPFWMQAFDSLAERGGGIIYIDELGEVTSPNKIPDGLQTCFRLGGEVGIGVWWAAQESTSISNVAIRQSDILALFLNIGASDRDKVIQTCGDLGEATGSLGFYEFVIFQSYGSTYDPAAIKVYKIDATT